MDLLQNYSYRLAAVISCLSMVTGCAGTVNQEFSEDTTIESFTPTVDEVADTSEVFGNYRIFDYKQADSSVLYYDLDKNSDIESYTIDIQKIGDSVVVITPSFHETRQGDKFYIHDYGGYSVQVVSKNRYQIVNGTVYCTNNYGKFKLEFNSWVLVEGSISENGYDIQKIIVSSDHIVFGSEFLTLYKVLEIDDHLSFLKSSYIKVPENNSNEIDARSFNDVKLNYHSRIATSSKVDHEYQGFEILSD